MWLHGDSALQPVPGGAMHAPDPPKQRQSCHLHKSRSLVPLSIYMLLSVFPHFFSPDSLSAVPPLPLPSCTIKLQGNHFVTVLLYILLPWETGGHIPRNECLHLFCHGQEWADDSQALVRLCHVAVCPKSPSSIQLEPSAPFRAEGSLDSLYWFIQLEKDIHKMDTPREFWKKLVYSILLCRMK